MNMKKNIDNKDNVNLLQHREEFETVYGIISTHNEMKAIVPIELAQIGYDVIVSFEMTQIPNFCYTG
jgi:hypothetical protein